MSLFFKKRLSISSFIVFMLAILLMLIFFRRLSMFLLLAMIASGFVYLNYYIRLPFDVSPVLSLSLLIAREYSFLFAVIFIFVSGIIPMVFAGGSFDHTTVFYLSIIIFVSFLSSKLLWLPFLFAGIFLMLLHHALAFIGAMSFGMNFHKELANFFTKIIVDTIYIFSFSGIIVGMIR